MFLYTPELTVHSEEFLKLQQKRPEGLALVTWLCVTRAGCYIRAPAAPPTHAGLNLHPPRMHTPHTLHCCRVVLSPHESES